MGWIVDGSNLGGRLAGAAGARDRRGVVESLLPWARGRRVVVVFDGADGGELATAYGRWEIVYSGAASADDVILHRLGRQAADWEVVTDDRALGAACRERGARWRRSADLLPTLTAAAAAPARSSDDPAVDVADWEEWFRRGRG